MGFSLKTPHGASLLQTDIHKVINGLYTPFGSPVIGGQKPYSQLDGEASYFFHITKFFNYENKQSETVLDASHLL